MIRAPEWLLLSRKQLIAFFKDLGKKWPFAQRERQSVSNKTDIEGVDQKEKDMKEWKKDSCVEKKDLYLYVVWILFIWKHRNAMAPA